jgi:hypothetical protein
MPPSQVFTHRRMNEQKTVEDMRVRAAFFFFAVLFARFDDFASIKNIISSLFLLQHQIDFVFLHHLFTAAGLADFSIPEDKKDIYEISCGVVHQQHH